MRLFESGASVREVSRRIGVSRSVVSRLRGRVMETERSKERRRSGRPRATIHAQDRFIVLQSLRDRIATANSIKQQLRTATNVDIGCQTIRNRLHEANLASRTLQSEYDLGVTAEIGAESM